MDLLGWNLIAALMSSKWPVQYGFLEITVGCVWFQDKHRCHDFQDKQDFKSGTDLSVAH